MMGSTVGPVTDVPPPATTLPRAEPPFTGTIEDRYADSTPDWPDPIRPPERAPNVVAILFDDLGFGQLSAFGGPCAAPNIAALADNGLRYNNFHTTSLCSPSRAALLTGRNHHAVGFATIAEMAAGFPGYNGFMPDSAATVAEVLRLHGYSTYCTGKWHLTPTAEATAAGPFDRWPLGLGFERFYGFLPGETDQWHPILTADNHRIPTPDRDGYHLSEDLVDRAITMLRDQQQVASGRPFFLYLPFGAVHCPFHVPPEYIERYRGAFDQGWDVLRRETFERQLAMGIIPDGSELPPRNPGVKPWDELDDEPKRLYCRLMETFAGMVDHTDAQIGRLVEFLESIGELDNTIFIVTSDNGAEDVVPWRGWSGPWGGSYFTAMEGSLRVPFIVRWPGRIAAGGVSNEMCHAVDLFSTMAAVGGAPLPDDRPIDGVDLLPFFTGDRQDSGREAVLCFVSDRLHAVKWRNWKLHLIWQEYMLDPAIELGVPRLFNLYEDPRERHDVFLPDNSWALQPAMAHVDAFRASTDAFPPIPVGTPDPYSPG